MTLPLNLSILEEKKFNEILLIIILIAKLKKEYKKHKITIVNVEEKIKLHNLLLLLCWCQF